MDNNDNDQPPDKNTQPTPENETLTTNDAITSSEIKAPANKKKIIIITAATILGLALIGVGGWAIFNAVSSEPETTENNNSEQDEDTAGPNSGNNNGNSTTNTRPDEEAKELFARSTDIIRGLTFDGACNYLSSQIGEDILERPLVQKAIGNNLFTTIHYKTTLPFRKTIIEHFGNVFYDKALESILTDNFADVSGVLYCSDIGDETGWDVTNVKISFVSQDGGRFTYAATYDRTHNGEFVETLTGRFVVKKVNENWKISEILNN